MDFRDIFNHVIDETKYEEVEKKEDKKVVTENKKALKSNRKKLRRVKESDLNKEERAARSKKVHEAIRRRRKAKQK